MPGNYIVLYGREEDGAVERILTDADRQVTAIAEAVSHDEQTMPGFSPVGAVIHGTYYPRFLAGVHGADAKFTVDDRCTACGTCVAVCPVGNVRLEAGQPAWLHHCEQCMACIQLCPVEAIQAGPKTASRRRYRHPGVTVKALADRDGE